MTVIGENETVENAVRVVTDVATMYIPLGEMIDVEQERARLSGELARTQDEIRRVQSKLDNAEFVAKAPERVVNAEREKLEKYRAVAANLQAALEQLG